MIHPKRKRPIMPTRDPNNWRALLDAAAYYLPHAGAALLTFAIAFTRGLQDGGPWRKAFLGALVCTLLTVGLYPVFVWVVEERGWPEIVALAPCVFLAFLGTEWIRNKADDLYDIVVGRWRK